MGVPSYLDLWLLPGKAKTTPSFSSGREWRLGGLRAWGLGGERAAHRQPAEEPRTLVRGETVSACGVRLALLRQVLPRRCKNRRQFSQMASRGRKPAVLRRAGSVSSRRARRPGGLGAWRGASRWLQPAEKIDMRFFLALRAAEAGYVFSQLAAGGPTPQASHSCSRGSSDPRKAAFFLVLEHPEGMPDRGTAGCFWHPCRGAGCGHGAWFRWSPLRRVPATRLASLRLAFDLGMLRLVLAR